MISPTKPDQSLVKPFTEPWHAELFATTHALAAAGVFDWSDWAAHFGAALAKADVEGAPRDGSTYFEVWLEAFETFLVGRGLAAAPQLMALKRDWTEAYLSTPHGEPVTLGGAAKP